MVKHEYSWPSRVPARTHTSTSSSPSDISVTSLNRRQPEWLPECWEALCMMGFVMEAESSSPRCLDLFLPHRTSKERGHKELTRIKGISMNRESRVGASCRDASPQHKSGKPGRLCSGSAFQLSHEQSRKPGWTECVQHTPPE